MRFASTFSPAILFMVLVGTNCWAQTGKDTNLWKFTDSSSHHNSVVQVVCNGGTGTGIIIGLQPGSEEGKTRLGYCLTAYHVVKDDDNKGEVSVIYRSGRKAKNCRVVQFNEQADVALVHVWIPEDVNPANLASNCIRGGETLEFAGLGGGSDISCCLRTFEAVASPPSSEEKIYADTTLLAGDSGGPVFNAQREVVGVISGGWFWYDAGVTNPNQQKVGTTWPARASNLEPIREMMSKIESTVTIQR